MILEIQECPTCKIEVYVVFMEVIPLCDIIKLYILVFTSDTTIILIGKYYILIVCGYMFRLFMKPSSGQLKIEQVPFICARYGIP
jgi:hypothetical protein